MRRATCLARSLKLDIDTDVRSLKLDIDTDVPRAKLEVGTCVSSIDYLTVSDTTSKVVLSSTDLNEHRRLLAQLRKCDGQATIFKALKF